MQSVLHEGVGVMVVTSVRTGKAGTETDFCSGLSAFL